MPNRPCVDCQTLPLCQAEGFNCGHNDTERVQIRKLSVDEMIIDLQVKVHTLTQRVETLEAHRHSYLAHAYGENSWADTTPPGGLS